jgi:uncharacterized lipoprotein YddW (UPF0748 family)
MNCSLKSRLLLVITILSAISFSCVSSRIGAQDQRKREFRGAWLHIVGNTTIRTLKMDQVKKLFESTLDSLKLTGCNAVIFQIRPQADAFYKSDLEPWSRYLTGVQGKAPEPFWDPLEFMIEEAHKRGMELHAWCNPYRVTSNDKDILSKEHLYYKNPSIFVRYGKQLYFDPGEPESIKHTVRVIADIVSRYDVDAIHFDDYFYPYPIKNKKFPDDNSFAKYAKSQGFDRSRLGDWRRHNVEMLIKAVNDTIKSIKPWVRFGISPFGIHRNKRSTPDGSGSDTNGLSNYEELFADVPAWAEKGYIDYIAPQLYWKIGHPVADYEILINWWSSRNYKGQLYIGQSISTFNEKEIKNPNTTQMAEKMRLERTLPNIDGNIWWPGWTIPKNPFGFADSLITKYQSKIALIPAYKELDSIPPMPVEQIQRKGREVVWKTCAQQEQDPMQKALFYAVYCFPLGVEINIENSDYLVAVTENKFYLPAKGHRHRNSGERYVVTALDRCWNESAPSEIVEY